MATEASTELAAVIESVTPQWRVAFREFVETGEASEEFLAFIDRDPDCQAALERAFDIKLAGLEALGEALKRQATNPAAGKHASRGELVRAVVEVTQLPQEERVDFFHQLKRTISRADRNEFAMNLKD